MNVRYADPNAPRPYADSYLKTRPKNKIQAAFPFDIELKDADGNVTVSNKLFSKKKATVVAFWLTTCVPCKVELNEYRKKFAEWQQQADFDLFAISIDFPQNHEAFMQMAQRENYPFPTYLDINREFKEILPGELNGSPQVFIFDSVGNIAYHHKRFRLGDEQELFSKILELHFEK